MLHACWSVCLIQSAYFFKTVKGCLPCAQQALAFTKMNWQLLRALNSPRHLQIELFPHFQV